MEVIAVIIIMGVIALIVVPISNRITANAKDSLSKETEQRVIAAMKLFVIDNQIGLPDYFSQEVPAEILVNSGYLEESNKLDNLYIHVECNYGDCSYEVYESEDNYNNRHGM